jgi:aromatic ring hydroxylase
MSLKIGDNSHVTVTLDELLIHVDIQGGRHTLMCQKQDRCTGIPIPELVAQNLIRVYAPERYYEIWPM